MTNNMISLCVFCGSSFGEDPAFSKAASDLGRELARRGMRMVYGGSDAGLMGIAARSALAENGDVTGIITRELYERTDHLEVSRIVIVDSMHERKAEMHSSSNGFIALPGGIGTLEELLESLTWRQLGIHRKPVGVLNTSGFFDPLLSLLDHLTYQGFLSEEIRSMVVCEQHPGKLLDRLFPSTA